MPYDDGVSLLEEYNDWVAREKVRSRDTTPQTFLVERAKMQAMQQLIDVVAYLDTVYELADKEPDEGIAAGMTVVHDAIRQILED